MTEPTDAELRDWVQELIASDDSVRTNDEHDHMNFARAVLAKWGTPQAAPEENTDYKILWDYMEENLVYADFKDGGYVNYIGWPDKDRRETLREEILLKALL